MPKILFNFPSRERPDKLIACIENIISLARNDDFIIGITLDVNDPSCANREFHNRLLSYGEKVKPVYGFSDNKIHAVNREVWRYPDADIICNMSDDFVFIKEGFDLDIISVYADGFTGLAHFPDGFVNERLCTFTIYDRAYYSRFGYIYFNKYMSVYADNEQHDVAKILGCYKYINKKIMEHRHFVHGFGEKDALLQRTEERTNYAIDGALYKERKKYNFYL